MTGPAGGVETGAFGRSTVRTWPGRILYHVLLSAHWMIVRALRFDRTPPVASHRPKRILLTGTFYAENWILNHVKPLAASHRCEKIWLVTTFAIPRTDKVEVVCPPSWLIRAIGEVPARLILFLVTAVRCRPDFVGGFHFLPNGLIALLVARLIRRRSLYICGGGPLEIEGGGYYAGSRSFRFLKAPDVALERKLLRAVGEVDLVITMGHAALDSFRNRGVRCRIEVVPGGIDAGHFCLEDQPKKYDLILVGRLLPVKRIDLFLRTVRSLAERRADVSAVVVGGGELEVSLKRLAAELGVRDRVTFTGQQSDVRPWLAQSKIFVLTSESEGLSLALLEAMTAGLPCVVSNVGELGEAVEHGKTGFLVDGDSPQVFSSFIDPLLKSESVRKAFSAAGKRAAARLTTAETAQRWDYIFAEF